MREIKFRVFSEKEKKMYFCFIELQKNPAMIILDGGGVAGVDETLSDIMQYTNLKDKNGVEIYENDFISCDGLGIRQVVWYELGAGWRIGTDDKDTWFNGIGVYPERHFEVIGNIYQNPELLAK